MPTKIQIPDAFRPLFQPARYKVFYGGRGGAKSWAFADALLLKGGQEPLRILCAREIQNSIKDSVHKLLRDRIDALGMGAFYSVTQDAVRGQNGTEFIFKGLRSNVDEIKSMEGVDICWVEEAHNVSEQSWSTLIPTIRKERSEIWVSFNPKLKTDATYRRFVLHPPPDSVVVKVGYKDNPFFTDVLRREMEHMRAVDYDEYLHVWEGELKTYADGAVYARQLKEARSEGRITRVPVDRSVPVHTFWDIGKNDSTAIWMMQHVGLAFHFVDYYEARQEDPEHFAKVLKQRDYLWGTHHLPHDADHHIHGMPKTRKRQYEDLMGGDWKVVPRVKDINFGLDLTRQMFPKCIFDEDRCEGGLDALAAYQYSLDEVNGVLRQRPLHNWASNGADAFRQCAQGYSRMDKPVEHISERRRSRLKQVTADVEWVV